MLVSIDNTQLFNHLMDWAECDCSCEAKDKLKIIEPVYKKLVKESKKPVNSGCIE